MSVAFATPNAIRARRISRFVGIKGVVKIIMRDSILPMA